MRIYLDACALNRLLDDQRQPRIRREAEVIEDIFGLISENRVRWIGGAVLEAEIARTPDDQKRKNALFLLELADEKPRLLRGTLARAAFWNKQGMEHSTPFIWQWPKKPRPTFCSRRTIGS